LIAVMHYLLDTNTCVAAMRHHTLVLQRLAAVAPTDCAISSITTYELYTGVEKCADPTKELAKVDLLLATVSELVFDGPAAREAGRIRARLESQGGMIGPYDVLLAGHARSAGLTLVTANVGEFSRVPGLNWENWQARPGP
jgi:tRNA(fMet)-specific endonuclease VapC